MLGAMEFSFAWRQRPSRAIAVAAGAVLALCGMVGGGALAEPRPCADPMLMIDAPSDPMMNRVCTAAMEAKDLLAQCDLAQHRPVVIEIRDRIEGAVEHCAGLYECGSDRVVLIPPDGVAALMPEESIFAPIPTDAYFDSLVVHELAHAFMDQVECAHEPCDAAKEYVAYALQVAILSEAHQRLIEEFRSIDRPVDIARLNDFLLYMKPDVFAAHVWAHFDTPGNGCGFVGDLVSGRVRLALPEIAD
jgi:hypothetical protein